MNDDVLMSIQPRFADAILLGTKTHELRRRFPERLTGAKVYVYASTPARAIIGSFRIASVDRRPRWWLARMRRRATTLTAREIYSYLDGQHHGNLVEVSEQLRFPRPVPLSDMRRLGLEPPQSYRFLSADLGLELEIAAGLRSRPHTTDCTPAGPR